MIQYYEVYNINMQQTEIWKGDTTRSEFLLTLGRWIKPLGTHKPSNTHGKEIKTF